MPLLEWHDSLSVCIHNIDEQHHHLMKTINTLYDALYEDDSNTIICNTISKIQRSLTAHFHVEESLMEKYHYPEAPLHKSEHDAFTQKMNKLNINPEAYDTADPIDLINMFNHWLVNHMNVTDKSLGEHLVSCGAS